MSKKMRTSWKNQLNADHKYVTVSFTVAETKELAIDRNYLRAVPTEITSFYLPIHAYNQILRELKTQTLLKNTDQLTTANLYRALKAYVENHYISLNHFTSY